MKEQVRGIQNWFARKQETRRQTKQTEEKFRQTQKEVFQLLDQIYQTEPVWQPQTDYRITRISNIGPSQLPQLTVYYPEFAGLPLSFITIKRNLKTSFLETRKLDMSLYFALGNRIDFEINFSNQSKIKSILEKETGPATFTDIQENKEGGLVGETLRLSLIKEVLSTILTLKQTAQVTSQESSV